MMDSFSSPLVFGIAVAMSVFLLFGAVWRFLNPGDPVEDRLAEYGGEMDINTIHAINGQSLATRPKLPLTNRILAGLGFGPSLARLLLQADVPLTAAELTVIILAVILGGFAIGILQGNILIGFLLGLTFGLAPLVYLRWRRNRRQQQLTEQLPDVLSLLVGSLRAGYGVTQAFESVAEQIQDPFAKEIKRMLRAINLGQSMQQALIDMAERIDTDDVDMMVVAINIQYETGGNISQTMETIANTIRERLRINREINVLTAQQRLTGYLLALLPIFLAIILTVINPDYMKQLFAPGWIRIVPVIALVMQIAGFLIMRKIVNIEV